MLDFRTAFRLLFHSISFEPGSMRFPSLKRILFILIVLPILTTSIFTSWIFLWLDEILFPGYRELNVDKNVFIIGMPRCGTTYLQNLICNNSNSFTAFSLGELVLAPSIIQKYFYRGLFSLDSFLGSPLRKIAGYAERKIFRNINGIHNPSFFCIEEDEYIFMYLFRSFYLHFLFPELQSEHKLLLRDKWCNSDVGDKMMRFYANSIRRHNYVFNRSGQRVFVSKNPAYSGMINMLHKYFPESLYINPIRNKRESFSSTLSLTARLYAMTCSFKCDIPYKEETIFMLVDWTRNVAEFASQHRSNARYIEIDFEELVKLPLPVLQRIYKLLKMEMSGDVYNFCLKEQRNSSLYRSEHHYHVISEDELTKKEIA